MKKLFAIITAFFMSLSSGTNYTQAPEKLYSDDTYTITDTTMPDYRTYFGGGESASLTSGCVTINYTAQGKIAFTGTNGYWFVNNQTPTLKDAKDPKNDPKLVIYPYVRNPEDGNLIPSTKAAITHTSTINPANPEGNKKDLPKKVRDAFLPARAFQDGAYIIAPFRCTLQSKSVSGSVHDMKLHCQVNGNLYFIHIANMKCWYCDATRKGEFTFHTSDEQCGKAFSGGQVLGIATPETTISIKPISSTGNQTGHCTMYQFYKGKYVPYKDTGENQAATN